MFLPFVLTQHTDLCQYMDKHPGGLHPDNVKVQYEGLCWSQ